MAVPRGVLGLTAMPPRPVGRLMRPPTRTRAKRGPRRGSMCGGDRAPSAPVFAAVEADARPNGRHAALHDAERDARCAGSLCLPAREVAHAERRWRMRGGSKTTPPAEAAPPLLLGSKARFLRLAEGGSQLFRLRAAVPRRVATSPVPATDPEHSEPGGAGVRGRALSGGSPRGARGAGAGPRGAGGPGFELLLGLPTSCTYTL